jgi:hypothetical protein
MNRGTDRRYRAMPAFITLARVETGSFTVALRNRKIR